MMTTVTQVICFYYKTLLCETFKLQQFQCASFIFANDVVT